MRKTTTAQLERPVSLPQTPWRDRPLQPMKTAAEILGISVASIYRFSNEGRLLLRRLGGRTLVETKSLIALAESAEAWTPNDRGKEARAKRKAVARESLRT